MDCNKIFLLLTVFCLFKDTSERSARTVNYRAAVLRSRLADWTIVNVRSFFSSCTKSRVTSLHNQSSLFVLNLVNVICEQKNIASNNLYFFLCPSFRLFLFLLFSPLNSLSSTSTFALLPQPFSLFLKWPLNIQSPSMSSFPARAWVDSCWLLSSTRLALIFPSMSEQRV